MGVFVTPFYANDHSREAWAAVAAGFVAWQLAIFLLHWYHRHQNYVTSRAGTGTALPVTRSTAPNAAIAIDHGAGTTAPLATRTTVPAVAVVDDQVVAHSYFETYAGKRRLYDALKTTFLTLFFLMVFASLTRGQITHRFMCLLWGLWGLGLLWAILRWLRYTSHFSSLAYLLFFIYSMCMLGFIF